MSEEQNWEQLALYELPDEMSGGGVVGKDEDEAESADKARPSKVQLYQGDCLKIMGDIPAGSVDLILCDLPYGMTCFDWDRVLPVGDLWKQYKRIIKPNGVVALFGSEPFSSQLRISNKAWFRYDWIWEKPQGTTFLNAKKHPLKAHETISVFYREKEEILTIAPELKEIREYLYAEKIKSGLNERQMRELLGSYMGRHYFALNSQFSFPSREDYKKLQTTGHFKEDYDKLRNTVKQHMERIKNVTYNPQKEAGEAYISKKKGDRAEAYGRYLKGCVTINDGYRYPKSVLKFPAVSNKERIHASQKPVPLLEYLIKTYTHAGETVLDNCMGSGATGVAAVRTGRDFIGIELDEGHYEAAKAWIGRERGET